MAIRGQADGMEGNYVVGWAAAQPDTGNCAITIVNSDGDMIAKGRASRHRPDLASLGLGRTTLAFRIAVPHIVAPRTLHVLANGEELLFSPIETGSGRYDGHATLDGITLTGWVTERVRTFVPPDITVVNQNGVEVGRGPSKQEARSIDPLFTPARFAIELADQCFGAGDQHLTLLANGVPFTRRTCNLRIRSNLERVAPQDCAGWMISPDAPSRNFSIEIYRDGKRLATTQTDQNREDVRALFPECSTPGFSVALPAALSTVEPTTISLRFPGSSVELFDGPYIIANRAGAVLTAYRAARLANMPLDGIGPAERAVLQLALGSFIASARKEQGFIVDKQYSIGTRATDGTRLVIVIPIYRGVELTRACIESVLAHRDTQADQLILINDFSPDAAMADMLNGYGGTPNVAILHNPANLGFVKTVNRGLTLANGADVLILNADTLVHRGAFDELLGVAHGRPEIGTVTAISNNATIFSYPHSALTQEQLKDVSWTELAAAALKENAGVFVDVPTGHGFCMLIKGEVIHRIGLLNESFGRGYGEENDFCARCAAIGYRNVAAGGVLVEHRESISFESEKAGLLALNLPRLNALYPEYHPIIMDFEALDGMRKLRWGLDRARLRRTAAAGLNFVLLVGNALEGGTAKAMADIEQNIGYGQASKLTLTCTDAGMLELTCNSPLMLAHFTPDEIPEFLAVLDAANPGHVLVHQFLGYPEALIRALSVWAKPRHTIFYAHDFYSLCPRVTMIDAVGRFCDVADTSTCARCVEMDGAHASSRLNDITPAAHRKLFAEVLDGFNHVIVPSRNAAGYLLRAFPGLKLEVLAHPENLAGLPGGPRAGDLNEIIMLGAIGEHKGSATLLEVARRARLSHPHLTFRVIGYTNIDLALSKVGNVTITGKFPAEGLPKLLAQTRGKLALFLSCWPETYSYTLSEAVKSGFIPLVPDIGAPADRVRHSQYGVVFPFPADAGTILRLIDDISAGKVSPHAQGATPAGLFATDDVMSRTVEIMAMPVPPEIEAVQEAEEVQ